MWFLRTIKCCQNITVKISDKTPYECPKCGTIYTVRNTSHPKYNPDVAQYDYLFVLVGGIAIFGLIVGIGLAIYALVQLF